MNQGLPFLFHPILTMLGASGDSAPASSCRRVFFFLDSPAFLARWVGGRGKGNKKWAPPPPPKVTITAGAGGGFDNESLFSTVHFLRNLSGQDILVPPFRALNKKSSHPGPPPPLPWQGAEYKGERSGKRTSLTFALLARTETRREGVEKAPLLAPLSPLKATKAVGTTGLRLCV